MINKFLEKLGFKKKKKSLYTKKQFTKYANYKGSTYVYDSYSNQWLLWYLIADSIDDGDISEFDMIIDNPHDIMEDKTYNTEAWMGEETTLNDLGDYFPKEYDLTKEGTLTNNVDVIEEYSKSSPSNNDHYSGDNYSSSSDSYSSSSYDSGSSSFD